MTVPKSMQVRAGAIGVLIVALFGGLAYRLYALQVRGHSAAVARKSAQSSAHVVVDRPRGEILDAYGETLAVSVSVPSVWAKPAAVAPEAAGSLAKALSMKVEEVERKLALRELDFVWIKRKVSEEEAARVRELARRFPAIGLRTEFDRRYPRGGLAAHVLGIVGETEEDDGGPKGRAGVERRFDAQLDGATLAQPVRVDGRRRILDIREETWSGTTVTLTIVAELQQIVEEELKSAVAEHRPKWAVVVVMDPTTGAILALANSPTYDPNHPPDGPAPLNGAVAGPYEPGSTIKVFFVAGALEEGRIAPGTILDCKNGLWKYGPPGKGTLVKDHHSYARLTVSEVIEKSSNIGAARIGAEILGKDGLCRWRRAFGFDVPTGIDLPGEVSGWLVHLTPYISPTRMSYGQGISVTPLQLVTAMSALANGGRLMRPYVVQRVDRDDGTLVFENVPETIRQVVSPATCEAMRAMMVKVVQNGTGKKHAEVEGMQAAGKTGTTQLINKSGTVYAYISSFAGFAPAENPRMCVAVVVAQPQGKDYYGGKVAGPIFKRIVERGMAFAR